MPNLHKATMKMNETKFHRLSEKKFIFHIAHYKLPPILMEFDMTYFASYIFVSVTVRYI